MQIVIEKVEESARALLIAPARKRKREREKKICIYFGALSEVLYRHVECVLVGSRPMTATFFWVHLGAEVNDGLSGENGVRVRCVPNGSLVFSVPS